MKAYLAPVAVVIAAVTSANAMAQTVERAAPPVQQTADDDSNNVSHLLPGQASETATKPEVTGTQSEPQASGAAPGGETWRYRKHNGQWWYWLPSEKWVIWSNNQWVAYDPQTYQAPMASGGRQRFYSSQPSDGTQWGFWGPVRYNQYGQRQYPYSQRNSGIQQLGPTPALGGVRALPGWGGER